jgi:hypothetical protein
MIRETKFYALPADRPAGLAGSGGKLWVSDLRSGSILEVETTTGTVVRTFPAVVDRPLVICADEKNLWQYDEQTREVMRTDQRTGETFPFGAVGGGINLPVCGLASNGSHLWILTPDFPYFPIKKNVVHKLELPWKLQMASFDAPSYGSKGLFFDGNYLWTADDVKSEVYMFEPSKGTVVDIIEVDDVSMLGIAKTADSLWTIDYRRNQLCRMLLDDSVRVSVSRPRRSVIAMTQTFKNQGPGLVKKWEAAFPVPMDYVNQKLLSMVKFSVEPASFMRATWDKQEGKAAKFVFTDLEPGEKREFTAKFEIETHDVRFHIRPERTGSLDDIPDEIMDTYMVERALAKAAGAQKEVLAKIANLFQLQEKSLKKVVEEAVGDEKNPYWIARKLYEHVIEKIEYILPYRNLPTTRILDDKKGSCTMQATLLAALCQAAGLPSRILGGHSIWRGDSRLGHINHRITEAYMPTFGWLPIDTTRFALLPAHDLSPATRAEAFGTFSNRMFIYEIRGDARSDYLAWELLTASDVQSSRQTDLRSDLGLDWSAVDRE